MEIQQIVQTEITRLLKEKVRLENLMRELPEGSLIITKTNIGGKTYHKWYSSTISADSGKKVHKYIPKTDKPLAAGLARRQFYLKQIEEIDNELDALNTYLSKHRPPTALDSFLDDASLVNILKKELPAPEASLAEELNNWVHAVYEKNPNHPEKLVVPTVTGEMVRSKSEAMILMLLEYSGIPYRYECRLDIDRKAYYPDFTIRHPYTGEIFYWEHVGMLDDPSYRSDFLNKLHKYINNGLLPDHNLILTYESDGHPLDIKIALDKIREFLSYDGLLTV